MPFCDSCGREVSEGWYFCRGCGATTTPPTASRPARTTIEADTEPGRRSRRSDVTPLRV